MMKIEERLEEKFGSSPVAMLALDEGGHVLWKNRVSSAAFPRLRRRMKLSVEHSACAASCEISGEGYFLVAEPVGEVRLCVLQKLSNTFSEEFAEFLGEYEKDLAALVRQTIDGVSDSASPAREGYLKALSEQARVIENCSDLLRLLGSVRDLSPKKTFAVSAGELVSFFASQTEQALSERGIALKNEAENGIVALLNFSDFTRALLYLLDFFSSFVFSKEICLSVCEASQGECVVTLSGEDVHDVLSLYRTLKIGSVSRRRAMRQCALFFPLFCALNLLFSYKHRVELSRENGVLSLRIFVRTTLELPTLVVRDEEENSALFQEFSETLSRVLYRKELLSVLSSLLEEQDSGTLFASEVVRPNLFE